MLITRIPDTGRRIEFATSHAVYRGTYREATNGNHVTALFFCPDDSALLFSHADVTTWIYID